MFWKLQKSNKKPFLLVEVIVALTLVSAFMPSLLKDQHLYKREIDKLSFLNDCESAFKELLFDLYYEVQNDFYIKKIDEMRDEPITENYKELVIDQKTKFQTKLTLERYDKEGKNYQISAFIEVLDLPYKIENLQQDPQHYWIPQKTKP